MAKLNTVKRNALPDSALDATVAKGRAVQAVTAGRLSSAAAAKIRAKANRVMGNKGC